MKMNSRQMCSTLDRFKARALAKPGVRAEYERLAGEFKRLDETLKASASGGSRRR
jgi:hypothetical protein